MFKGGTALSKCYRMIDRFSEDIDLVVFRRERESNNKLATKIRTISDVMKEVLPEIQLQGLTNKMGMNRKTVHTSQNSLNVRGLRQDYAAVEQAFSSE